MLKSIRSLKNPLIKHIVQLQDKAKVRKDAGQFVIEGTREITMAIEGGFKVRTILFGEHLATYYDVEKLVLWLKEKPEIIELSREVHQRLFIRETTEAFIAIVELRSTQLSDFTVPEQNNILILVAEAPEKPGNIGALLRTADGAGVDAVMIANPRTDIYNSNVIRASLGCLFSLPIFTGTTVEIINLLKSNNISIFSASLEASIPYDSVTFPDRTAIVVGAEDIGLSDDWVLESTQNIIIPMNGKVDSLNVSVSVGILLYEVVRQKTNQKL